MAKSNNITKTFVGEAHVSTKKKSIKTSPSYFWSNIDGIATDCTNMIVSSANLDCTNMTVTSDDSHIHISAIHDDIRTTESNPIKVSNGYGTISNANTIDVELDKSISRDFKEPYVNTKTGEAFFPTSKTTINVTKKLREHFAKQTAESIDKGIVYDIVSSSSSETLGNGRYLVRESLSDSFDLNQNEPTSESITEDVINHPKHYNSDVFPQVIDMMLKSFTKDEVLAFCKLNSFKYRMRAGVKDATKIEQDINKAIWYENKFKELNQIDTNLKQIIKG